MALKEKIPWIKGLIHIINLSIFLYLCGLTLGEHFGADPLQGTTHFTGKAAINSLFITLLVSPVAKWLKQSSLFQIRRLLGLYCFAWASLHLLIFIVFDIFFDWQLFFSEISQRKYLIFGMLSWTLLLVQTITSPTVIRKKCGAHWQTIHDSVYLIVIFSSVHYFMSVKSNLIEPSIYMAFGALLLLLRYKKYNRYLGKLFNATK
jgi:sulfoxide reductase heme-binding subunit YedZ